MQVTLDTLTSNSMQCNAMQFRLPTNAYEVRIKDKIYTTMYKNIVNEDTLSHYILHRNTKEHEAFVLLQGQKKTDIQGLFTQ